MLVIDGYGSHLTKEFVDYCYDPEVKISVFLLPAYSTHILQPLDISMFQSYKHYYQELLEDSIRFGGIDYKQTDFLASFQKMRDLTFKERVIRSAFEKSGLYPFDPSAVLSKLREFSSPEQRLRTDDSEDELYFEVDFKNISTLYSLHMYEACTNFIRERLAKGIETRLSLSPTVARVYEKREKASKTLKLSGQLAIEELYKKRQEELDKARLNRDRHIQQFRTILVRDARLRAIVRNEAEDAAVEAIHTKKEESQRKKEEYRARVESRKADRLVKKAQKDAQKAARVAQLAQIIADNP
jgi:DDE superfamily endonuclease